MVRVRVEVMAGALLERLRRARVKDVPERRRNVVLEKSRRVLRRVIKNSPVDEGRMRSAWVTALRELGAEPPGDWQGPDVDGEEIAKGATEGSTALHEAGVTSEIRIVSEVPYVRFVEYGTRKMAARRMVRRSLGEG